MSEAKPGDSRLTAELRALRGSVGLSLRELQDELHVSDSSLSRYLSGQIVPPWSVVEGLCRLAGRAPGALRPVWEESRRARMALDSAPPPESGLDADPAAVAPGPARKRRWRLPIAIGTAFLVGTGAGLGAGLRIAESAAPPAETCAAWPWPSPGAAGRVALPAAHPRAVDHVPTVDLVTGTGGGEPLVWGRITGARYGDRLWIDVSGDHGATWTQCGPFPVGGESALVTRAHRRGPQWTFRACGDTPRPMIDEPRNACTRFW